MRVIECNITLILVEGEHFNPQENTLTDEEAKVWAEDAFLDVLNTLDNAGDLHEYVQSKITEGEVNGRTAS